MIRVEKGEVRIDGNHEDLMEDLAGAFFAIRTRFGEEYGSGHIGDMFIQQALKTSETALWRNDLTGLDKDKHMAVVMQESLKEMLKQAEHEGNLYEQEMLQRMMNKLRTQISSNP